MRFAKPVYIGDTLRVIAATKEKRARPRRSTRGYVVELVELINQAGETALACKHAYLVERRTRA